MANFDEINFKLLVISNYQGEIGEKLELWNNRQSQINQILTKQYVLLEESEVVGKIVQFLIKKLTKISEEIREINQKNKNKCRRIGEANP